MRAKLPALVLFLFTFSGLIYSCKNEPIELIPTIYSDEISSVNEDLHAIKFTSYNNGFIIGKNNAFYRTTDAGNTWQKVALGARDGFSFGEGFQFNNISFPSSDTGYVTGNSSHIEDNTALYKTTDGGKTWAAVELPLHFISGYIKSHFPTTNIGYVISTNENLLKTIDGGKTWDPIRLPAGVDQPFNIYFATKDIGFITDFNDMLYRTENGGHTWKSVYGYFFIGTHSFIKDFSFFDSKNGYLISASSDICITQDGGKTWRRPENEYSVGKLNAIEAPSANVVFAAGASYIGISKDKGQNWEKLRKQDGTTILFDDISFFDDFNGYGINNNKIYRLKRPH